MSLLVLIQSPKATSALSRNPIGLAVQLVQSAEVGLGRRDHDVWIRAYTVDHPTTVLQTHRHLTLAFS